MNLKVASSAGDVWMFAFSLCVLDTFYIVRTCTQGRKGLFSDLIKIKNIEFHKEGLHIINKIIMSLHIYLYNNCTYTELSTIRMRESREGENRMTV